MHTKWTVLRVVTDLRGGVELGHLLVDEECVRDPDLLDVVSTHHQLAHLRLGHGLINIQTSRHVLTASTIQHALKERAFAFSMLV